MEQNYRIFVDGEEFDFQQCIEEGHIVITPKGLKFNDDIIVHRSSGLVDKKSNEIFEQDILVDARGTKYRVEYYAGTFFIGEVNGERGCMPWALHGLKFGKRIDNMQICQKNR